MSTYTDGAPPSVSPGAEDGPGPPAQVEPEANADGNGPEASGSSWLQEEMRRRMEVNRSTGGGRHARREGVDRPGVEEYLDRHIPRAPQPAERSAVRPGDAARPARTAWMPDPYAPTGLRLPPPAGPGTPFGTGPDLPVHGRSPAPAVHPAAVPDAPSVAAPDVAPPAAAAVRPAPAAP
ncbi:hypothetical protein HF526_27760, partial [Pseudonocardia sp. K10HN5]|nr:hypothetical protein [Pseudonocardia acidicola]